MSDSFLVTTSKAFSFKTYKNGRVRTVGTAYIPRLPWNKLDCWQGNEAQAFARMWEQEDQQSNPSAKGKVVFLFLPNEKEHQHMAISCYQVKGCTANAVFCGNAAAGGVAAYALTFNHPSFYFSFICVDQVVTVAAETVQKDGSWLVNQNWQIKDEPRIQETEFFGCPAVACSFLNDYLIVKGPLKNDAYAELRTGKNFTTLRSKVAVIENKYSASLVQFFNCNGLHGSAPQTGLATIALLATRVDWIKSALQGREIRTHSGSESLPLITQLDSYLVIRMPSVSVRLNPLRFSE